MLDKEENGLKLLFMLSPYVRYYAQTFDVLLPNNFKVANRTFSMVPLQTIALGLISNVRLEAKRFLIVFLK